LGEQNVRPFTDDVDQYGMEGAMDFIDTAAEWDDYTSRVNYFSVTGRGWIDKRDTPVNVQVDGSEVYRSAYPDPEGFWKEVFPDAYTPVSLRSLADQYGWDEFRHRISEFAEDSGLERWFDGNVAVTRPVEPHEIVSVEDYWGNEYK